MTPSVTVRTTLDLPIHRLPGWSGIAGWPPSTASPTAGSTWRCGSTRGAVPRSCGCWRECLTSDVLGSERCDCGPWRCEAVQRIAAAGGYPFPSATGGARH